MTDKIVVLSTCDSAEHADRIARHLVERQLAACVNIISGARSVYRWQGKVEEASDFVLIIKPRRALWNTLQAEIAKVHTYDVPEVIALEIVAGSTQYLDWIDREACATES